MRDADNTPLTILHTAYDSVGWQWSQDTVINPTAKAAARMLLVQWHENPAQLGSESVLSFGLNAVLLQLKAEAVRLKELLELTT